MIYCEKKVKKPLRNQNRWGTIATNLRGSEVPPNSWLTSAGLCIFSYVKAALFFVPSGRRYQMQQNPSAKAKVLETLSSSLPPFFKLSEQPVYSMKSLYNMICLGNGPEVVTLRGIKYLERDSFLSWLDSKPLKQRGRKKQSC